MTLEGIDISSHQPDEDWPTLKANGIAFVAIKRVGGDGYVNPYGRQQVAGARKAGLVVIHYLYLGEPGCANVSGEAQADYFIAEVGDDILPGEGISVDWEERGYADIDEALACLGRLEARYGFKPSIYTYPSYIVEQGLARDARVARYPLWFASYRSSVPEPPAPWSSIMAWQYSDHENIPGVGHVDGDRFFGTVEELKAFGKPAEVVAEVVPPPAPEEYVHYYIDDRGRPHIDICYGGVATGIVGINVQDAGCSVIGDDGAIYDRSVQSNVFQKWVKRD